MVFMKSGFGSLKFHMKFQSWGASMGNGHVTDVTVSVRGELVVGTEWGVGRTAPMLSMHVCMICILCVRGASKECSGQEEGADAIPGRL